MLRRFPNTEVTARWSMDDREPRHRWSYLPDKKRFLHRWDGHIERSTEDITLHRYDGTHWNPQPFYHITDPKQQRLAIRMAEELVMKGMMESVISDCNIGFMRECGHCHALMDEGWLWNNWNTFCSDECLMAAFPSLTPEDLREIREDDSCLDTFWNEWVE